MAAFSSTPNIANLTQESGIFVWKLTTSGFFTVKSMYADMLNGQTILVHKYIQIFMWFIYRKVIYIKDNLAKRN
jgi:hypothetical protein